MAEQERAFITERTFLGRKEKATRGGFAGGSAPLGYARDQKGGLVEDGENAETVRRIFAMRDDGETPRKITAALNAEKVPTERGGPVMAGDGPLHSRQTEISGQRRIPVLLERI